MTILDIDLETFSAVPITNGTHAYARGAEILLTAWGIDDGPVSVVDDANGEKRPAELREALADPDVIVRAHNSHFDRTILRTTGTDIPVQRWRDTMVKALAHSLPGSLGDLCDILKIPSDKAKDKDGRQLIHLFCKPRPATSKIDRATRGTHPAEWERFKVYAGLDIHAMRAVDAKLPVWNYRGPELDLWFLDQRINDRGVAIDLELVAAAIRAVDRAQHILASRTRDLTDGAVAAATQRDAMLRHLLAGYGVELPDLQMATLERRIADPDLPEGMRELLQIRLQASTTSTAKYRTLAKATNDDGRLRGTLQFNGASRTGRWAGRLFQPQNLPRPVLKQEQVDIGIAALKADAEDLLFGNVMELTSSVIRGCIVAPKGKKLVVSDLSNIEGRDQAWLAGETWKLQAFRAFDAGDGHDLYKLAYAKSFGIRPEDVSKDQRQVGKVQELALGYEGGVGAFLTFAAAYNIDLEAMGEQALGAIPDAILAEARSALAWTKKSQRATFGLSDQAWLVCESFKRSWRQAHPAISSLWGELADTVRAAIASPGVTMPCRRLKIRRDGTWLRIGLPSGRCLCYPAPKLEGNDITYMGVNQYSRKWSRLKTYGGKLFENVCQAVARDVLTHNMPLIEAAGYEVVLTVHDEVICEAPDSEEFNAEHLSSLLAANPPWAQDMPLAAGGFEAYRYRKD
jgi:DNA polymerase bacteriophage-type